MTKSFTIRLDCQLGRALRQYKRDTHINIAEVTERALRYYWLAQKTSAAAHAINTMDLLTDEAWAAFIDDGKAAAE